MRKGIGDLVGVLGVGDDEDVLRGEQVGKSLNRKFEQEAKEKEMTLRPEDFLNAMRYILDLRGGRGEIDDIDHLGNRRVRTIQELAADEFRKGFLKLRRTVQERMSLKDAEDMTPRSLINPKSIFAKVVFPLPDSPTIEATSPS